MSLPSFALVALALFVVASGSATAASLLTSKNIKDESIQNRDLRDGAFTLSKLRKSTKDVLNADTDLTLLRLAALEKKAGIPGPAGAAGAVGAAGAKGADGDSTRTGSSVGAAGAKGDKGDTGATGPKGDNGANADGSTTASVKNSGDSGFTLDTPAGSGGDNGTATLANGQLKLSINSTGGGFAEITKPYNNVPLNTLTSAAFKYAVQNRGAGTVVAPVVKIDVLGATACDSQQETCNNQPFAGGFTTLVFEPAYTNNGAAAATLDLLDASSNWYSTRGIKGAGTKDTLGPGGPQKLSQIMANNPNAKIQRIYVNAGQNGTGGPWNGFDGTVDYLNLGFDGNAATRFDFG